MTTKYKWLIVGLAGIIMVWAAVDVALNLKTEPEVAPADGVRTIAVLTYEEPRNPNNLKEMKIATVAVTKDGALSLNVLKPDYLQINQLQRAVAAIARRPALKLIVENEEVINGQQALVMKEIGVLKTDAEYIYAVRETLAREFGFKGEIEQ